ncbi:MAG: hypothetical protein ACRC0M_04565 [Legionella sp.]
MNAYSMMNDDFDAYLEKNVAFSPFTSLFNQTGMPALSMPHGMHQHLPLAVQCAAATGGDQVLFAPARELADNNDSGYAKPILVI